MPSRQVTRGADVAADQHEVRETEAVAGIEAAPGSRSPGLAGWCARRRADWASWLPLTAGLAVVVLYFALPDGSVAKAAILPVMCAADAGAALIACVRARGLARVVWVWHAVGLTSLTAGASILNFYPVVTGRPIVTPSLAD